MIVQPYLMFAGRCAEAVEFYRTAAGAKVDMLVHFKDAPDPAMVPPGMGDNVMHACLRFGDTTVYASDGGCDETGTFAGFALSMTVQTADHAERLFAALCDGGTVRMPLAKTFWAARFGMLTDRFGVRWQVMVEG